MAVRQTEAPRIMTKCGAAVNDIAANSPTFFMRMLRGGCDQMIASDQASNSGDAQTFQVAEHSESQPPRLEEIMRDGQHFLARYNFDGRQHFIEREKAVEIHHLARQV